MVHKLEEFFAGIDQANKVPDVSAFNTRSGLAGEVRRIRVCFGVSLKSIKGYKLPRNSGNNEGC